ncbi:MAG: hypothetical protein PHF00_01715, partial [Elusimicrobia bacterium]|nr:hypothetical protein [Elusimicrobiota bacterium]
ALKGWLKPGLAFIFVSNAVFLASWVKMYGASGAVLGTQTRAEYLEAAHSSYPHPPYRAIEFINEHLPADARVLFLGEARGYYCRRDRICPTSFDRYPLHGWVARSPDTARLRGFFRESRISHVLLDRIGFQAWLGTGNALPNDERSRQVYLDFAAEYLRPIFHDKAEAGPGVFASDTTVYEVADRAAARNKNPAP